MALSRSLRRSSAHFPAGFCGTQRCQKWRRLPERARCRVLPVIPEKLKPLGNLRRLRSRRRFHRAKVGYVCGESDNAVVEHARRRGARVARKSPAITSWRRSRQIRLSSRAERRGVTG